MKTNSIVILLAGAVAFCSCNGSTTTKTDDSSIKKVANLNFKVTSYDFGKIQDGDTVSHEFGFVNLGNAPLLISDVSASCGCTAVEWPREPIMPQHSGKVKVQFSKRHAPGQHSKTAIVKSNTTGTYTILRIKALISEQKI